MISKTVIKFERCKTMHIAYYVDFSEKNYYESHGLYKDIVPEYLVGYQTPGSKSMTNLLIVATGYLRNHKKELFYLTEGRSACYQ